MIELEEHLAILTLQQSWRVTARENTVNKTLYDFVPCKVLTAGCYKADTWR